MIYLYCYKIKKYF